MKVSCHEWGALHEHISSDANHVLGARHSYIRPTQSFVDSKGHKVVEVTDMPGTGSIVRSNDIHLNKKERR